jgi:hypothetical protein
MRPNVVARWRGDLALAGHARRGRPVDEADLRAGDDVADVAEGVDVDGRGSGADGDALGLGDVAGRDRCLPRCRAGCRVVLFHPVYTPPATRVCIMPSLSRNASGRSRSLGEKAITHPANRLADPLRAFTDQFVVVQRRGVGVDERELDVLGEVGRVVGQHRVLVGAAATPASDAH